MLLPRVVCTNIDNFLLIKYLKSNLHDIPSHVNYKPKVSDWNKDQEEMFRTILNQIHYFYPNANIHVLSNEKSRSLKGLIWHYRSDIGANHTAKFELYSLLDVPAMYIDSDIVLNKPFSTRHLSVEAPFNLYQYSSRRNLQTLSTKKLEFDTNKQYNCGMIWIPRPSKQITEELKRIRKEYFDEKDWIEQQGAWFNNDEHPTSYFVEKYAMKMKMFPEVNQFRNQCKYEDIFKMQSIHYTGVRNKKLFFKEYKEICKSRIRFFN